MKFIQTCIMIGVAWWLSNYAPPHSLAPGLLGVGAAYLFTGFCTLLWHLFNGLPTGKPRPFHQNLSERATRVRYWS